MQKTENSQTQETNQNVIKRGRHVDTTNYHTYIHRILKNIYPHLNISKEVLTNVNKLLVDFHSRLIYVTDNIADYAEVKTLSIKELKTALTILLPVTLRTKVFEMATASCNLYDPNFLNKSQNSSQSNSPHLDRNNSEESNTPETPKLNNKVNSPEVTKQNDSHSGERVSRNVRADLTLAVSRIEKLTRDRSKFKRLTKGFQVYLTSALECLAREILTLTGHVTIGTKYKLIKIEHLIDALQSNHDLSDLFAEWLLNDNQILHEETAAAETDLN